MFNSSRLTVHIHREMGRVISPDLECIDGQTYLFRPEGGVWIPVDVTYPERAPLWLEDQDVEQ